MTSPIDIIEVYTEPIAVLEVVTDGPPGKQGIQGQKGDKGDPAEPWPDFQGTWSPDTRYDKDDGVSWNKVIYVTNGMAEVGTPPSTDGGETVNSGWYVLVKPGPKGDPGPPGNRYLGEFGADTIYIPGDIVRYDGKLYFATNTSVPAVLPPDPNYWQDFGSVALPTTKFTGEVPAGADPIVEHNLNTDEISVTVINRTSKAPMWIGWAPVDENHVQLSFERDEMNPQDGEYFITVLTGL